MYVCVYTLLTEEERVGCASRAGEGIKKGTRATEETREKWGPRAWMRGSERDSGDEEFAERRRTGAVGPMEDEEEEGGGEGGGGEDEEERRKGREGEGRIL